MGNYRLRTGQEVGEYTEAVLRTRRDLSIQRSSLGGRLPPPATLAHKEEMNKMRMNEVDREVHGFRSKLAITNAKSSIVHENNQDAACMDEIERTERKSSVQATLH